MRLYGRYINSQGQRVWTTVETDANGNNDGIYLTALCQYFKGSPNESPRFAWAGIPAEQSVQQQVPPDFYASQAQQLFAPYFASLIITRGPQTPDMPTPYYNVNILTHSGVQLSLPIAT
jgi:hypothetical protein